LGRLHFSPLSARFFFHFWQHFLLLRTRKGAQDASQLLSGAGGGSSTPQGRALLNNSLTAGEPYQEVGQDLNEVHVSCLGPAEKPRKTMLFWLNRHLGSSSDLMDVHHPSSGKTT